MLSREINQVIADMRDVGSWEDAIQVLQRAAALIHAIEKVAPSKAREDVLREAAEAATEVMARNANTPRHLRVDIPMAIMKV